MFVDANFVTARTVMASRFDKAFACTPVGTVEPSGRPARWESFAARPLRAATNAGKELGFTASHALPHAGHVKFAA